MKDSKPAESSLPFVWPVPGDGSESKHDGQRVPFQRVADGANSIAGIVSDIDSDGVAWLERVLCEPRRKVLIVLAVYAGCPTRSEHLSRLLALQSREAERIAFRILPMTVRNGAPANSLTVIPQDGSDPVCLFGATPNFGIPKYDPTQFNVALRSEPRLIDKWCSWFDRTWIRAAPLTKSTADIPNLVPATGSAAAAAQWRKYCEMCSNPEQDTQRDTSSACLVEKTGSTLGTLESDGGAPKTPSASIGLHKLDQLGERMTRLLRAGKQVTVANESAVKPLDVPIRPRFFDQDAEKWLGPVVRHQSFRISAFSAEEQKLIDNYRTATRTLISKLGLRFGKARYWMSHEMIPILKVELSRIEMAAKADLVRLVGPYAGTFVSGKRQHIKQALENAFRGFGGEGDLPEDRLQAVLDDLESRIQNALGSEIVPPITTLKIDVDLQQSHKHEAPYAQVEKLLLALAQFPRSIISKPNMLLGIGTDRHLVLDAMNVEDDAILKLNKVNPNAAIRDSKRDLQLLDRIANSDIVERDRCEIYLMIIQGNSDTHIHDFINIK